MNNISFSKGLNPNIKPLEKPMVSDPTKLGRRSLEEVRNSMKNINNQPSEPKKIEVKDSQMHQQTQQNRINAMKNIGNKRGW